MTQFPNNVSYLFLVLLLLSFLATSGLTQALQIPCALPDEFSSKITSQDTNLTLIPGHTQKLTINLKAENDDIMFEFISNITHPSLFQLSTFVNGHLESTSLANFVEPETLTILFDEQTKACFISGDKGFSSTRSLLQDSYEVMIDHNGHSETENISSGRLLLFIFSAAVGVVLTIFGRIYGKSINSKNPKSPKAKRHREQIENHLEHAKEEAGELGISLEMSFEDEKHEKRMPTVREIKALVKEMEEKGMINFECNPSEDSDAEDQYEAPELPNYFCCMLCFEGTRCTVVEPCRHVFACESCIKKVVTLHQSCVLCSKIVTGYEPLVCKEEASVL